MRDIEIRFCDGCDKQCRVPGVVARALGGTYYCDDCEPPEGHPQHPDSDWTP